MNEIKWVLGIDISTQTISAMLMGVAEKNDSPYELVISSAWIVSRDCSSMIDRRNPPVWVQLIRECIGDLKKLARETEFVESIGISTAFPGAFPIFKDGSIDPDCVSLYDSVSDAGICVDNFDEALGMAEADTHNRMWPGNMVVGLVDSVRSNGLDIEKLSAIVPPNTAFAYTLLRSAGQAVDPLSLPSDFTQLIIGGLYNAKTLQPLPAGVENLLTKAGINCEQLKRLLPKAVPSWKNVIPESAIPAVCNLLELPHLNSISIGAGDSPLGSLALLAGPDTIINVRGSSDSPMVIVDSLKEKNSLRETMLHYPLPTVITPNDSPWCVVAPMLRSGKVWDWVKLLRYDNDPNADAKLEALAIEALKLRLTESWHEPVKFVTSLGGERAPSWDSSATASISGLNKNHTIGDIAIAALEGMSITLRQCISMMEERYEVKPTKLLLAGGPTRNLLWNWVTGLFTGKETYATTFSDASLLGAAMIGYGASFDRKATDEAISERLFELSNIASNNPLITPTPVKAPDAELAELEKEYIKSMGLEDI